MGKKKHGLQSGRGKERQEGGTMLSAKHHNVSVSEYIIVKQAHT